MNDSANRYINNFLGLIGWCEFYVDCHLYRTRSIKSRNCEELSRLGCLSWKDLLSAPFRGLKNKNQKKNKERKETGESTLNTSLLSLPPDCECSVISSPHLLLPCLSHQHGPITKLCQNKLLLPKAAFVRVFYQSSIKVTKTDTSCRFCVQDPAESS